MQLIASEMGNTVLNVYILSCYLNQIVSHDAIDIYRMLSTDQSCTIRLNSNEKNIRVEYKGCFHEPFSGKGLFNGTYYNLGTSSLSPATCLILCHEYTYFGLLYLSNSMTKCFCISAGTKHELTEVNQQDDCGSERYFGGPIGSFKYVYLYEHHEERFVEEFQQLRQSRSKLRNSINLTVFCTPDRGNKTRANFICEFGNRPHTGSNTGIKCSHEEDDISFVITTTKYLNTQTPNISEQFSLNPEMTSTIWSVSEDASTPTVGWNDTALLSSPSNSGHPELVTTASNVTENINTPTVGPKDPTFVSSPTYLGYPKLVTTASNVTYVNDADDFNNIFILGCTLAGCLVVVLLSVLALLKRRNSANANRVKITSTTENGPSSECSDAMRTPMPILQENYSDPCDKIYQVPGTDQNPGYCHVKPSIEEYHHLDFTLRSESKKVFHVDDGEYFRPRANTDSVFDQPWDNKTSKLNRMFMQFRSSVYDSVKNVRNSFLRKEGNNVIPENKKVYSDDWQPPFLGHHQSVANAACKPDDISIEIGTAENNPELKEGPVLNQSNDSVSNSKPDAKFDEIYREPRDRRISFRQRLSMMTSRPLKLSFGFDFGFGGDSYYHQNIQPKSVHEMPKSFEEAIDIDETSC